MGRPKFIDEFSSIECRFTRSRARLKDRRLAQWRAAYAANPAREMARVTKCRIANPDKVKQWDRNSYKNRSLQEKLVSRLRGRLYRGIKAQEGSKSASTLSLTGCSIQEVKIHLEKQFLPDMSWDNFGMWHIDHIRPCISFDLQQLEQQKLCFHFTNLQPLWAKDNLKKGSKITEDKFYRAPGY